jgi:hypothetical protein
MADPEDLVCHVYLCICGVEQRMVRRVGGATENVPGIYMSQDQSTSQSQEIVLQADVRFHLCDTCVL